MSDQQTENRKAVWLILGVVGLCVLAALLLIVAGAAAYWMLAARVADDKPSGLSPEFDYAVEALQPVDPERIGYLETGSIALSLREPRGIAIGPGDSLYVAGDETILVRGSKAQEIKLAAPPRAIAVDADGTIYVAMKDHVEVYSPAGERRAAWQRLAGKALLTSIAVGESGVFVADAGNREVVQYDRAGKALRRFARKDPERGIPGLIVPSPYLDVAIGRDGLLRVGNPGRRRVETYTMDGDLELSWGRAGVAIDGFSGCCNPSHLAVFPDGRVVTSEKGTVRVKVYDAQGELLTVVAAAPDSFEQDAVGLDLAVDSRERVFVLDPGRKVVRIFSRKEAQ